MIRLAREFFRRRRRRQPVRMVRLLPGALVPFRLNQPANAVRWGSSA